MLLLMSQPDQTSHSFSSQSIIESRRASPRRARSVMTEPLSPSSIARGKGGCWTCRLRRKKCDEQQEGGSCHTCLRLKIECLGWGIKRPEWMRDKAAVEDYKKSIKQQLTTQGMIRGQPRTPSVKSLSTTPKVPAFSMPHPTSYMVSSPPSLLPPVLSGGSGDEGDYDHYGSSSSSSVSETLGTNLHTELHSELPTGPDISSSYPFFTHLDASPSLPVSSHPVPSTPVLQYSAPSESPSYDNTISHYSPPQPDIHSAREYHVFYYFQQVRNFQFPFAGGDVTSLLSDIIVREPLGQVSNAICALAALHERCTRRSPGLHVDDPGDPGIADRFYDDAAWQISNSKQQHGHYTDMDAMAAIHMLSFWLFSGGSGDWPSVLDVACDWLGQQPLAMDENPLMALLKLNTMAKFIAKATMWMDIFASITVMRPPRFLSLYRRLLRGGAGFWAARRGPGYDDVRMDGLMGCPDEVMLAIAEISSLAHWKSQQIMTGTLSVRELVRRGDAIEKELRSTTQPRWRRSTGAASSPEFHHVSVPGSAHGPGAVSLPNTPIAQSPRHEDARALPELEEDIRTVISDVFRESVLVYLHSVLADSHPRVPEIMSAVKSTTEAIRMLPPSSIDRALVFPICLAGSLSDGPAEREFYRARLSAQDLSIGNVGPVLKVLEAVWETRDRSNGLVSWRDVMREMNLHLLLI